jgi:protein N-terminal amidase
METKKKTIHPIKVVSL